MYRDLLPKDDGSKLLRDYGVHCQGLLELTSLARHADPAFNYTGRLMSLARIVERYTQKELWKGPERMSDWEAILDRVQQECK